MKNQYVEFSTITKEILDTIKIGDYVKCNNWNKPMQVIGVSENYFVMIQKNFGDTYFSVCEKKKADHSRNNYTCGSFRMGTDDYIGGYLTGYKWDDEDFVKKYLAEFESGETELSVRRAIDIHNISIKSA